MDAILVRCNPGQIKQDGGDQQKFDNAMRALQAKGKPVWPSPDVMDAILVRCNPGQIKQDGGDQQKFDNAMRALQAKGKPVWPSPDVMEFMGAKDALTKIKDLNIGMPDTGTYYSDAE